MLPLHWRQKIVTFLFSSLFWAWCIWTAVKTSSRALIPSNIHSKIWSNQRLYSKTILWIHFYMRKPIHSPNSGSFWAFTFILVIFMMPFCLCSTYFFTASVRCCYAALVIVDYKQKEQSILSGCSFPHECHESQNQGIFAWYWWPLLWLFIIIYFFFALKMDLFFHPNCIQRSAFHFRYNHIEKFSKNIGRKKMIVDDTM